MDQVGLLSTPLIPDGPHSAAALFPILHLIYDGLFQVGPGEKIEPALATGYTFSSDGLTLTMKLRSGAKFQDGTPVNAAAVVYNLDQEMDPANAALCAPDLAQVKSVTAPNPATVVVSLKGRDTAIPMELAATSCGLMASPAESKKLGSNFGLTPGPWGSGPFQVTKYVEGTSITLTRNPTYWNAAHTYLNGIQINGVGSGDVAYDALLSGGNNLDASGTLGLTNYKKLESNSQFTDWQFPSGGYNYSRFEVATAPFNNLKARQAVVYATNQVKLVQTVQEGIGSPSYSVLPPDNWAYNKATANAYPRYNLAKAKALVKQLGGLTFTDTFEDTPSFTELNEALQAQWAQAGITVKLNPLSSTAVENAIHTHNYQYLQFGWGESQGIDPDSVYTPQFQPPNFGADSFNDPVVIKALARGRQALSQSARKAAYNTVESELNKQLPWDFLPQIPNNFISSKSVHGVTVVGEVFNYNNIWISST